MAFNNYLIKIGNNDTFFNKFIVASSYKISKKVIDIDSYRDANGVLHRNAMSHLSYTIEFEIKPLDNKRMQEFLSAIRSKFIIPLERKVNIEFYLPEDDEYTSSDFYMPDPELNIERIESGSVYYTKTTIKFIGYWLC